jgi:prepilin-type N-terminal cleavage/methylation domain-containing protein
MRFGKGFTLFEILIVIAILCILYSIAASNVIGMQNEARMSRVNADLKTLQLAIESYNKNNGTCPKKDDYQVVLLNESPNIIMSNLLDPFGKTNNSLYKYEVSYNRQSYVLFSVGHNHDGMARIFDDGKVVVEGSPILLTNGYL